MKREPSSDRSETASVSGGGESRVGAILDCLPAEYVVFHDLRMPGAAVTVDHLVVGPGGVYAVGAREYPNAVTFGMGADADSIWTGGQRIDVDSVEQTAVEVERLVGVRVRPVMCIVAPMLPGPVIEVDGVAVCHPSRVITEVARSFGRKVDVAKIARRVGEVFDAEPQDRSGVAALSGLAVREPLRVSKRPWFRLLVVAVLVVAGLISYRVLSETSTSIGGAPGEVTDEVDMLR